MTAAREWFDEPALVAIDGAVPLPSGTRNSVSGSDWIWFTTRIAIYMRDGEACLACGATEGLSLDHVIPKSKGGHNRADNLVTLCMRCNRDRYLRPMTEWRPDLVRVVRRQLRRPLDRAAARARAEQLRPGRLEKQRVARRRQLDRVAHYNRLPEAPF